VPRADELVKGACLMVVGIGTIILRIPGNNSLKGKRRVVKSIVSRLQNAFNASVAEVGANDSHQRAEIGLALVGNDRRLINSKLDKALNLVEDMQLAEIIDTDLELMNL
jgi:uncharacterized protein YlxP (DUF503 family)